MLHDYLAAYYAALRDGIDAQSAHALGILALSKYEPELKSLAYLAQQLGQTENANLYADLAHKASRIAWRYYNARGRSDAAEYEVLLVEHWLEFDILDGISSRSIIDLVTRSRRTDRCSLWEHKSTENVPDARIRLRDLQTLLYATALSHRTEITIDEIVWNYLRTKEPVPARRRQDGMWSRDKHQDTTWEMYSETIQRAGGNPDLYHDMKAAFGGRELGRFFPRYEHVIVVDPKVLLDDYATTASRMRVRVKQWDETAVKPTRTFARDCDWCPYYRLCEAAITGGDESDVIRLYYMKDEDNERMASDDVSSSLADYFAAEP